MPSIILMKVFNQGGFELDVTMVEMGMAPFQ